MRELVFFLEEESAKALLEALIPRMPGGADVALRCVVFEGKQDLRKNLERKLRGYLRPDASFFVVRDQDRDDCHVVKDDLRKICRSAGRPQTVVRIACRELESFYLGDLRAVEAALELRGLAKRQNSRKFRDPDRLQNPAEELEKLTQFAYQKVAGSRAIGMMLDFNSSQSTSFLHLARSILAVLSR